MWLFHYPLNFYLFFFCSYSQIYTNIIRLLIRVLYKIGTLLQLTVFFICHQIWSVSSKKRVLIIILWIIHSILLILFKHLSIPTILKELAFIKNSHFSYETKPYRWEYTFRFQTFFSQENLYDIFLQILVSLYKSE